MALAGRRAVTGGRRSSAAAAAPLSPAQKLTLYYWMRLTRSLEERLVSMHRQNKLVGGLFRSLGQEADAVGSAFALEPSDVVSSLTRNLGSLLVKGATPVEVMRQHMGTADSPTRGRDLGLHFADLTRGFIGHISPLGNMVSVMAGVTLSFTIRGERRVGLVYVGEGATSTGAFHEGLNFAAVQKCPLVVIVENNGYAYSTPTRLQSAVSHFVDKAAGYGVVGEQADGNDVLAVYDVAKRAVDRARAGGGVTLIELLTYRRRGHAEHDNQSYVPPGEMDRWAMENDPIDRYLRVLVDREKVEQEEIDAIDTQVSAEIDAAETEAATSPVPAGPDALRGVYADPPAASALWYR
jgi:TPP-dependent pyruvate/acetoin dehydrogenase alpha subunit